jgi:rhodanese-related sulfurtransferase
MEVNVTNFLRQLRQRIFGKPPIPARPLPQYEPEPEPITIPELSVDELQQALSGEHPPLLLDVREPYEWRQGHISQALHIPMNEVPQRLAELPATGGLVVFCAHGMRSYDVAGYLIEQGYQASSLAGGISEWARAGGEISR